MLFVQRPSVHAVCCCSFSFFFLFFYLVLIVYNIKIHVFLGNGLFLIACSQAVQCASALCSRLPFALIPAVSLRRNVSNDAISFTIIFIRNGKWEAATEKKQNKTYLAHLLWSEIHVVASREENASNNNSTRTEVRSVGCEANVVK